jgi:hypothetical protein
MEDQVSDPLLLVNTKDFNVRTQQQSTMLLSSGELSENFEIDDRENMN